MVGKSRKLSLLLVIFVVSSFAVACGGSKVVPDVESVEQAHEGTMEEVDEVLDDALGSDPVERVARARMMSATGESLGEITFTQTADGVQVRGEISGLDPNGARGFHVHEFGKCDGPDFMSAGGHFNPGGHDHGAPENSAEARHAGDFGNIEVDAEGKATIEVDDSVITLNEGMNNVVGHALIIHAQRDDLTSQPTGDAGARAACGIIEMDQ